MGCGTAWIAKEIHAPHRQKRANHSERRPEHRNQNAGQHEQKDKGPASGMDGYKHFLGDGFIDIHAVRIAMSVNHKVLGSCDPVTAQVRTASYTPPEPVRPCQARQTSRLRQKGHLKIDCCGIISLITSPVTRSNYRCQGGLGAVRQSCAEGRGSASPAAWRQGPPVPARAAYPVPEQ